MTLDWAVSLNLSENDCERILQLQSRIWPLAEAKG
jgi:hypothetical protein